jgi:hypothetical protein
MRKVSGFCCAWAVKAVRKRIASRALNGRVLVSLLLANRRNVEKSPIMSFMHPAFQKKSHRQSWSGGGILELLVMILEDLAPCARRRTHAAGTTEASLLGLLDVGFHGTRVLKQGEEVNTAFPMQACGAYKNRGLPRASSFV